jgi:hypothetical protein
MWEVYGQLKKTQGQNQKEIGVDETSFGPPKINCDASFWKEIRDGAWGYIIRDNDGGMP